MCYGEQRKYHNDFFKKEDIMKNMVSKKEEYIPKEEVEKVRPRMFLLVAILLWFLDGFILIRFTTTENISGVSLFAWVVTFFFVTCGAVGFSGIAFMSFSIRKNAGENFDITAQKETGG